MKHLLLSLFIMSGAIASDVDHALQAADDFDNSYSDTISESGNIKEISRYHAFTILEGSGRIVQLTNRYLRADNVWSVMIGTYDVEKDIVSWRDAITGEEL